MCDRRLDREKTGRKIKKTRDGARVGDVGDYFADFCAKVGEVMRKTYGILLFVGETVLFLAVFRWLGGVRWLYSMLSAFAADDGKSGFF